MVGLAIGATAGTYTLSSSGQFNASAAIPGGSVTLANANEWYQFSGTISYSSTNTSFVISNLSLSDIGSTGLVTPGPNLLSTTSFTKAVSGTDGSTLVANHASDGNAYFGVFGNEGRGLAAIDNIDTVPEPVSLGLLAVGGLTLLTRRQRRVVV